MSKSAPSPKSIRNFKLASDLFQFAYEVKKHQLRLRHPEMDESRLHDETMEQIRKASR